jgi:hypothetical protein
MDKETLRAIAEIVDEVATEALGKSEFAKMHDRRDLAETYNAMYYAFDWFHEKLVHLIIEENEK